MAIALQQHTDESSGALSARTTKLSNSAKIAYVLFTGIVKDKVGYTIREYAKNAWEVSPADKPFLVDLPTRWTPRLRIRDFGPGLSHHFMMHRYPTLGDSTKDTNGIGGVSGWGLGSKSGLAYLMEDGLSGSYSVISYREAIASHYIISLDAGGMPQVKHFMDVPTEEPDGLEVSFAVRPEDFQAFEDAARRILWSFEPRPVVTPDLRFREAKVAAKGGNWTMFEGHTVPFTGPQVRVGPVMYPIDMGEIEGSVGFLKPTDHIIFDMDPDQVSPTASREQLQYTGSTKRALSAMVQEYERTFIEGVQTKVDAASCYFAGCEVFHTETYALGHNRSADLRNRVTWGGQPIRTEIDAKTMHLRKGWSSFERFRDEHVGPREVANAKVVVEHNPYLSLDRFLALDLGGEEVLWARVKRDELPGFLAMCALKEDDVIILDKAPLEKRPTGNQHGATKTNQIRRRRVMRVAPRDITTHYDPISMTEGVETVDLAEGGIKLRKVNVHYARRKDHYSIGGGHRILNEGLMRNLLIKVSALGIITKSTPVLIDTGVDDLDDNWHDFGDYMELRLRDLYDPADVTPQTTTKSFSDIPYELRQLCDQIKDINKMPDDLRLMRTRYNALTAQLTKQVEKAETVSDRVFDALSILRTDMVRPLVSGGLDPVDTLIAEYNAVIERYPLLDVIRGNYRNRDANLKSYFNLILNQKA